MPHESAVLASQTSTVKLFTEIVNDWRNLLTVFAKIFILGILPGFESTLFIPPNQNKLQLIT